MAHLRAGPPGGCPAAKGSATTAPTVDSEPQRLKHKVVGMAFSFLELLERRAAENPVEPAVIGLAGALTVADLVDGITKVANRFDDLKLKPGSRLLLNVANPAYRLLIHLAALEYGLISIQAQPPTVKANYDWDLVVGTPDVVWRDVPSDIVIDQTTFSGKFADGRRRTYAERPDNEIAYIAETSGTTGRPKLVAITRGMHRRRFTDPQMTRFQPGDRFIQTIGSSTKFAVQTDMTALAERATVIHSVLDVAMNLRLINLHRANVMFTTPAFLQSLVDLLELKDTVCPSLERIRITGASCTSDFLARVERRFKAEIWIAYGSSEVEASVANGRVTAATYSKGYVGRVNPTISLVTTGTRAKPSGIAIANSRDLFALSIVGGRTVRYQDPFFAVPDLGYFDGSDLYIVGRSDEVYNFSGFVRAYSALAEDVANLARVSDVAIVSGASIGHDLDLLIAVVSDGLVDTDAVAARLAERLSLADARPHFKVFRVPHIRRNPQSGKVDRVGLIQDYQNRNRTAAAASA